jgi:hypothetical protein
MIVGWSVEVDADDSDKVEVLQVVKEKKQLRKSDKTGVEKHLTLMPRVGEEAHGEWSHAQSQPPE